MRALQASKTKVAEAVKAAKPVEYEYTWRNKFLAIDYTTDPKLAKKCGMAQQRSVGES